MKAPSESKTEEFIARAAALREETRGRVSVDGAELIRQDRDRDHELAESGYAALPLTRPTLEKDDPS